MAEEEKPSLSVVSQLSPAEVVVEAAAAASERPATVAGGGGPERARRRTMSRLYAELGELIPNLPPRASTARIVEEAIAFVKELRGKAAELEAYRSVAAVARGGGDGAEVVACGNTSCFAVRLPAAWPGALTRVVEVFQRHGVAVLAVAVARDGEEYTAVTVTTAAVAPRILERIKVEIICAACSV